jgi:hypothetical protein
VKTKELLERLKEFGFTYRRTKTPYRIFIISNQDLIGVKRTRSGFEVIGVFADDETFASGKEALMCVYGRAVKIRLQIMRIGSC